ncbi:MmyB family transcriptional regulator [Kitasatospora purpeofusca]|uniref:MmyB family transcriptional regulator n=1 Tax=Kitasatospora purpeofusca TaxID=67352 RepID=UPI0035DB947E
MPGRSVHGRWSRGWSARDKALSDLIGELSTRGDAFGQRWARHDVRHHRAGAKRVNQPLVGELTFTYETTRFTTDDGLFLVLCAVPPGRRDAEAFGLLASWTTPRPVQHTPDT